MLGPLPSFIIIGTQRGGTTYLHDLMLDHPQVSAPLVKEIQYFDGHYHRGTDWYRAHFSRRIDSRKQVRDATSITFEATPDYMYFPRVPGRIKETIPNVKLIAFLRNPVDRAYSHYRLSREIGVEPLDFEQAIAAEWHRLGDSSGKDADDLFDFDFNHLHYSYISKGCYAVQLERWFKVFNEDQLLIIRSEDLYADEAPTLEGVARFLNLPEWRPRKGKTNSLSYPPMKPATRAYLTEFFESHNAHLSELLGTTWSWS
jgi:hypothetical protein